jgi:hypothetical protein
MGLHAGARVHARAIEASCMAKRARSRQLLDATKQDVNELGQPVGSS